MNLKEIEILLVEDNMADVYLINRAFKNNHLLNKLHHVKDGYEAIHFIFGTDTYKKNPLVQPKLILLDLKMPKMDGMEVLKILKSNETTKHIPIVVLTSSKQDPDIKKCYNLGANSYVVKAINFRDFSNAVSELGTYWMLQNQPSTQHIIDYDWV